MLADAGVGVGKELANTVVYPVLHGAMFDATGDQRIGSSIVQALLGPLVEGRPTDEDGARKRRPLLGVFSFETDAARGATQVTHLHLEATAPRHSWASAIRSAALVAIYVDGTYQSTVAVLEERPGEYDVDLGQLAPGRHSVELRAADDVGSAFGEPAHIGGVRTRVVRGDAALVDAHAPIIESRDVRIGHWHGIGHTDTPLLLVPEVARLAGGGRRIDYRLLLSNEDGGTPVDRLFTEFGRSTDYELVYSVTLDRTGRAVDERYQAPMHRIQRFQGRHVGQRPVLRVSSANNNFSQAVDDHRERWSEAPQPAVPANTPSTRVMTSNPWTFQVMARELAREHRVVGVGELPAGRKAADARRYIYLDGAWGPARAALRAGISVQVRLTNGRTLSVPVRADVPEHSGATAAVLPVGVSADDIASASAPGLRAFVLDAGFRPRTFDTAASSLEAPPRAHVARRHRTVGRRARR